MNQAFSRLLTDLTAADADPVQRQSAIKAALTEIGRQTPTVLIDALSHPLAEMRELTAQVAGELQLDNAHPALLHLLGNPREKAGVRRAALQAVEPEAAFGALLHAPLNSFLNLFDAEQRAAFQHFVRNRLLIADTPVPTRRALANILSAIGDETSLSLLLDLARHTEATQRELALNALEHIRNPHAVEVLIEALGDRQWPVRQRAIIALSRLEEQRALPAMLPLVNDPEWRVRLTLAQTTTHFLTALAQDADRYVRRAVMEKASELKPDEAANICLRGVRDSESNVRLAALHTSLIRHLTLPNEALIDSLNDPEALVRGVTVRVLVRANGAAVIPQLLALARDPAEGVRAALIEALSELGHEDGISVLDSLLRDDTPSIREQAACALAHLATAPAIETLTDALQQPLSKPAAQSALLTLGHTAAKTLLALARSEEADSRAAAAEMLGQISYTPAQPTLRLLFNDPDLRVRGAAVEALKQLNDEG